MFKRCIACIALALASGGATAQIVPDPSGLWYDPAESGWGLTVAEQGDKVFAVLFVYDPANRPAWYFASDLQVSHDFLPFQQAEGALYRSTGPWFGGTFDPHAVTVTPAGTMKLVMLPTSMQVTYVIDGTTYTKSLQPQTWADGHAPLAGNYEGGLRIGAKSDRNCPDLSFAPSDPFAKFTFQVLEDAPGRMRFLWNRDKDTICVAIGQYAQRGQLGTITGTIGCGGIDTIAPTNTGPNPFVWSVSGLAINEHGFSGSALVINGSCTYSGNVGGVRTAN